MPQQEVTADSVVTFGLSAADETVALQAALQEVLTQPPVRRGLAVANLLVSALLAIGGFLVTARRPISVWWIHQALIANVAYTLASAVGTTWVLWAARETLVPAYQAEAVARAAEWNVEVMPGEGVVQFGLGVLILVGIGLLMLPIYFVLWRLLARRDVREFLGAE